MCEHYNGCIEFLALVQQEENDLYNMETWELVWEEHLEPVRTGGTGCYEH